MLGLAKDLFKQSAVSLDDFTFTVKSEKPWPHLQKLLHLGYLNFVDYSFARAVLNQSPSSDENQACFLALMMAFSRLGHLCVSIHDGELVPSVNTLASASHEESIDLMHIEAMAIDGASTLPAEILATNLEKDSLKPLVKDSCNYYLQKNYHFESLLVSEVLRIFSAPQQNVNLPTLSTQLTSEQQAAVAKGLKNRLLLITGGPGTGKTFTATHLISSYLKLYPGHKIAVAAPTGKAVSHLKKKILAKEALQKKSDQLHIGTLHALLGIKRADEIGEKAFHIPADCVIVDESSMIDLALFTTLLQAIPDGTKLILMGDDHQLPPVESGTVFCELCQFAKNSHPELIASLKTCQRSEQREILDLSQDIRHSNQANVAIAFKADHCSALKYYPDINLENHWREISFPCPSNEKPSPEELFAKLEDFRILTPLKKGPFGVSSLNKKVWSRYLQKVKSEQYWAIPIIITKTSYQLDLCNGEMGYLIRNIGKKKVDDRQIHKQDYALFVDKDATGYREIPATLLPSFDQAYAISVHKSQGSEYKKVLFILPEGSENFGKEILYTGVTRAKNELIVSGSEETIRKCLERDSRRNSGLAARLKANG